MSQSNAARKDSREEGSVRRKPVDKFHDGSVHVSIWENEGVNGAFRTASFQLRYKDQRNEWQTGINYGVSDLKHLEKAAVEAHSRIESWQKQSRRQASLIKG